MITLSYGFSLHTCQMFCLFLLGFNVSLTLFQSYCDAPARCQIECKSLVHVIWKELALILFKQE